MAIGPLWAISLVTFFGMKGTLAMIVPGILIGAILLLPAGWLIPPIPAASIQLSQEARVPFAERNPRSLALLISFVIIRSWMHLGLISYIPFYYIEFLKGDPLYAGKLVSTFLMAGALGTLIGAPIADAWGHKKFVSASMILVIPLLFLFYKVGGWVAFIIIGLAGMVLVSSFSVTIVMAQTLLPQNVGLAAGLVVGFAMGTGGVGVTLLGAVADRWGVPMAIQSILILPLLGLIPIGLLKYPTVKTRGEIRP
jgi:FSR family fosmidomycin resistance protein-like MFS transporter